MARASRGISSVCLPSAAPQFPQKVAARPTVILHFGQMYSSTVCCGEAGGCESSWRQLMQKRDSVLTAIPQFGQLFDKASLLIMTRSRCIHQIIILKISTEA